MNWFERNSKSEVQEIHLPSSLGSGISLNVLREDQLFDAVSGNKFRKLRYSISDAIEQGNGQVLSFGGAFSNHIAALASASRLSGIRSIGVIRGEELAGRPLNPTLSYAKAQGMELHFISRAAYRLKEEPGFLRDLTERFGDPYIIPEGGTAPMAIKGCAEIWESVPSGFDRLCVAVGTGGTLAGLVAGCPDARIELIGYSALAGTFQKEVVASYTKAINYRITDRFNFGGYAKIDADLVRFINEFRLRHGIALDPVYTGKMMYGIYQEIQEGSIPKNTRILAVHTGGLQGIAGMNERLKRMNLPLIETDE